MSLLRFLGLARESAGHDAEPRSLVELGAELESLPPEEARFVSAFAYLLARIAGADLRTDEIEKVEMARHLEDFVGIDASRAELLAQSAVAIAATYSPSDDHLVTRAFRDMSEHRDRIRLLRCLYAVAAADERISTREDNEIFEVARMLEVAREDVIGLRSAFRQYLGALRPLPTER